MISPLEHWNSRASFGENRVTTCFAPEADPEGPIRLELSVEMNDPESDQQARASLKIEMYDYGKPLDAFLPPADEVVDVATLQKP